MASGSHNIKHWLICLSMLLPLAMHAQNRTIDSLQTLLKKEKRDSMRSLIYIELASNYSGYDTAKAIACLKEAAKMNSNNHWDYNNGYYYQCYSNYLSDRAQFSNSLQLADTAISFYKKAGASKEKSTRDAASFQLAETIMSIGTTFSSMGKSEDAIKKYQESLQLFEATTSPLKTRKIATVYNNIATVFFLINQYEKGLEYDLKSIPYHIETRNDEMLAFAYTYVASDYMRLQKHDSAKRYFEKAAPIVTRLNKNSVNIEYYGKIAEMYWWQKNWTSTRKYYAIAYENAEEINNQYSMIEYLWGIAACLYNEGNYVEADKYLNRAKVLTEKNQMQGSQREMYGMFSQNYYKLKNYKLAYEYLLYYNKLKDSVANMELKHKVAEMDEQYQSQKRQQQIVQLEQDKQIQALSIKQSSTLNYILIGSVVFLLLIGFLAYRNLRNRQQLSKQQDELQQQRIRELEKDKQLVAVDAMLKGQEKERSRLAKDLHDGLGGLLSGVKFSLSNMKENLIVTPDNSAVFERSLDMLDTSIMELRRVAHNMMPEMLTKFGLDEALKEYCASVSATKLLAVKYQSHGMADRVDISIEIIVYRIVQELLNNILKHASATEAFVQLIREDGRLNVVVEDNGKGFDTAALVNSQGAGWVNIRSRVEYLKGQLDIHSGHGKGTLVTIEFNV
ncbi:MAG: sensor histidine kinase [Chitinophagaceae bacterium]